MGEKSRIEQFESLLAQDAQSEVLRYGLGDEYLKAGRFDAAAESFRAAIRLKPQYTAAYRQLGKALEKSGDAEGARHSTDTGVAESTRETTEGGTQASDESGRRALPSGL